MRWPALRFEVFFERYLRRKAVIQLGVDRDNMLAAIASNPNWDMPDNKDKRDRRVEAILSSYKQGVEVLSSRPESAPASAPDPFDDDPLFRSLRQRAVDMRGEIGPPVPEQAGIGARLLEATP